MTTEAVIVKFLSLGTGNTTVKTEEFVDAGKASAAIVAYAMTAGFTNVKSVADDDYSVRFTATTPGGRSGRNVAFMEPADLTGESLADEHMRAVHGDGSECEDGCDRAVFGSQPAYDQS